MDMPTIVILIIAVATIGVMFYGAKKFSEE